MTLSPRARALFDEAREASEQPEAGVPDDARRRMRANVLAAVAAGGATAAATAAKAATAATAAKTAQATSAGVVGKAMMWLGGLSTGKVVVGFVAAAGLTLGGLTVLDPVSTPEQPEAPSGAPRMVAPAEEPPSRPEAPSKGQADGPDVDVEVDEDDVDAATESTPPARSTAPTASVSTETLEQQAALLMRARDAIRRGQHGEAQRLLDSYRDQYGKGALGEEQEALGVLNLCGRGDPRGIEEAKRFAARHPGSPLLQRIEQSCR